MAASSLSVAATATAVSSSSCSAPSSSSSIEALSFTSIHFPLKFAKPKKISTQKPNFYINSPPFSAVSRSLIFCSSSAFDGVETTQSTECQEEEESGIEEQEEEEEVEEEEEENEGGNDEGIKSQSAEARRLYVGNLPFSMTSSQLADIFAEAGRVVSVEVCFQHFLDSLTLANWSFLAFWDKGFTSISRIMDIIS